MFCPLCARSACTSLSNARDVPLSTSSVMAATMSACLAISEARSVASAPIEVISCVPLMSARPSLALSSMGERLWLSRTYLASPHPVEADHICPSPMRPSARCERGARSPVFHIYNNISLSA